MQQFLFKTIFELKNDSQPDTGQDANKNLSNYISYHAKVSDMNYQTNYHLLTDVIEKLNSPQQLSHLVLPNH
jgi:hypothetical protein